MMDKPEAPGKGKEKATVTMHSVRLKNMYAVLTIRKWITQQGWQKESTFTIICYLKGHRPMSRFTDEQLEEIARHEQDPENIDRKIVPDDLMVCLKPIGV